MSIPNAFQIALEHHQAGRLPHAEAACRQILAADPSNPAVLHLLGVIALQVGRSDAATELIRKAVSLKPDYVDAHFNLAVALSAAGRPEEAVASYRQVVSYLPGHADAWYNMGVALQQLDRLDEAIASYREALSQRPGFVQVHNNLGAALQAQGRLDDAVTSFRAALLHRPTHAEAHYNLGNALKEQGKLDEAIACYRHALAIVPAFPEALDNLGVALHEKGDVAAAIASYRQALALKPDWAETLGNLAMALQEQGEVDEAMAICQRALSLQETAGIRNAFVQCVKNVDLTGDTSQIWPLLTRAISEPWTRPGDLVAAAFSLVTQNQSISESLDRAAKAWPEKIPARELFGESGLAAIAGDLLLRAMLENAPVNNLELEQLLTMVRRTLLDAAIAENADEKKVASPSVAMAAVTDGNLPFYCALARQCFNNEYIFSHTPEEFAQAQSLRERLIANIAADASISALVVIAVSAYFPLTFVPGIEKLPDRSWPDAVGALLTQQVREPSEEKAYRTQVNALTPIDDDVSRLVREQYEENPYPRWVKSAPGGTALPLNAFLRRQFPHAPFKPLARIGEIDVLIAGCGTGQHPIDTAQQYCPARILAVDLSLSSICYAWRKTREAQLSNIEYAQADIMRLGSIGRSFDVIESVGVLHHLRDPLSGWRILLSLMRPGGFMRLGLYSELARQAVVAARERIAEQGYSASAQDIRRFRQEVIALPDGNPLRKLISFRDFFGTSECRDLLFHVQEHRTTLPELKKWLAELDIDFLGFSLDPGVIKQYATRFPADTTATDLDCWNSFEIENPDTFAGMYQFWIQKRG